MRLSEAIRLGSLAIQNPLSGNSSACALAMGGISVGVRVQNGCTGQLVDELKAQWPHIIEEVSPYRLNNCHSGNRLYERIYDLFDNSVMHSRMTLEALCDQVRVWEDELEVKGINVEQVTMAAELTEPASPTQSIQKELAVATPRGGE